MVALHPDWTLLALRMVSDSLTTFAGQKWGTKVLRQRSAPSERADVCNGRQICLAEIPTEEAEKISLMFQIMGWSVVTDDPVATPMIPQPMFGAQPARLSMQAAGNIITVASDDRRVMAQMAAAGLDRLVMPVSLPALEQLMVFAG
jgi:hypothetical protein